MSARSRVAVVLGAGGPVGHAFHAGVLAALAEEGWDGRNADLLVGTSVGAITAGLLRAGLAPSDLFAYTTNRTLASGAGPTGGDSTCPGAWAISVPPAGACDRSDGRAPRPSRSPPLLLSSR
ncbi:MAG: patatin-like phospholipase family protein [Acidimicrobiales bacterium]